MLRHVRLLATPWTAAYQVPPSMGFSRQEYWSGVPSVTFRWCSGKESACQCRRRKRHGFDPWVRKFPSSRNWQPTPVFSSGKFHGQRSLVGYGTWVCKESDTAERLTLSLSCIGEGNGNPLQCSCLENPRDGGAWWAAVSGVAQSWTRLMRLSSSSSSKVA